MTHPSRVLFAGLVAVLLAPSTCLAQRPVGTLANGLQVYCIRRQDTSLCTIDLWVRAGSLYERAGEYGCAHFLEHTLFDGSGKYPDGKADMAVETLGGIMDAATGPDYAHFYTTVPAQNRSAAITVMANMLRQALLPKVGVERERKVILDELALRAGNASERAIDAVYAAAFPAAPYGRSPGGTPRAITALTQTEIAAFYRRRYQPDKTALVVAGDITPGEALSMANSAFGTWRNRVTDLKPTVFPQSVTSPTLDGFTNLVSVSQLAAGRVAVAFRAPRASHAQRSAAMQLMREILNHDSQFGLAANPQLASHHALAVYVPRLLPSLFIVLANLKPGDTTSTAEALTADIQQSVANLAVACTVPSVAAYAAEELLSGTDFDTETLEGEAYEVGYAGITNGEGPQTLRERLHQLPLTVLQQVVRGYLGVEQYLVVVQLPCGTALK